MCVTAFCFNTNFLVHVIDVVSYETDLFVSSSSLEQFQEEFEDISKEEQVCQL